ncbi:ribosomal protein L7/L12 [Streptomyces sp. UG1]|uniref:ribosomal protein L7/L12 n=1 Tax=Streptomyces sp. UG1 TaxID=3417652 RepID=UPI003CF085D4
MDMTVLFFVLFGVLALLLGVQSRFSQADKRVARIERKLDLIIDHLGLREDDPRMDEVVALLRDNRKIQAIKLYREITGAGLKEAKDAVEQLA